MPPRIKALTEIAVCDLLDKYACPVPHHEVPTRFQGAIASPVMGESPLQVVKALWGGKVPPLDFMDDVNHLLDLLAGIEDLVARDVQAESRTELETTLKHVRELTRIMKSEIHEAVLSCNRAQRQMLEGLPTQKPTMH